MHISVPGLKLGIVGAGQLGRMMAVEARRLGIYTIALDPAEMPPARGLVDETLCGSLYDAAALNDLASKVDVLTFEIEHTDAQVLSEIERGGKHVFPRPSLLRTIQDKFVQKSFLKERGLPVPAFSELSKADAESGSFKPAAYPFVQKARSGGYDGRGVAVIRSENELGKLLPVASMIEECIDFEAELSILLARGRDGKSAVYPLIEMVFDPREQICSSVCVPARVPAGVEKRATEIALAAVEALDGVGVFAVELFLTMDGQVLINEIAPRPHNSGHWTIEGAVTDQFAQHVRAVCGLPLGDPSLLRPSVMVNLLGAPGAYGKPELDGYGEALAIPGLALHWYQKVSVSPYRKMGHVTITHDNLDEALRLSELASSVLTVKGNGGAV